MHGNLKQACFRETTNDLPKGFERSISKIIFQVACVTLDGASFSCARDSSVHALHEPLEFLLGHAVLLKRIIIRIHSHRPKRDNLVAMENADIFAIRRTFQQGGQVSARVGRRQRGQESILRRYGEQLKGLYFHLPRSYQTEEVNAFMKHFAILYVRCCRSTFAGFTMSSSAENDLAAIKAEVTKRHDEAVKRFQDWIAQV